MNHTTSNNGTGATAAPITAWAIKAPDGCKYVKDIPLIIPTIYGLLATVAFVIIANPWVCFITILGLWAIGTWLMVIGWKGYRCVRVQITEVQQ